MLSRLALIVGVGAVSAITLPQAQIVEKDGAHSVYLFPRLNDKAAEKAVDTAFVEVVQQLDNEFDHDLHQNWLQDLNKSVDLFKTSQAFNGYETVANQPRCGASSMSARNMGSSVKVAAYPGGVTTRLFNFDLAKLVDKLADKAAGPAAAQGGIAGIIAMQGLMMASSVLQNLVSNALHIIPPRIPPPVWNNQPLFCLPMVTGHNCFGAIFHPITVADFAMAETTDSQLDGVIASFPATFREKVGVAPDALYKGCFAAYMSMNCASIFPKCMAPQTGNDATAMSAQRVPMCFVYCISTLVACPGFWIDDILGACQDISAPPACASAFFWRMDLLPPQYASMEGSGPAPQSCPPTDVELDFGSTSGAGAAAAAASLP